MHEKDMRLSLLYDYYSELLSAKQRQVFELYYNEDLSLSEISEQLDITRQGVRDICHRAEEELCRYEERLALVARFQQIQAASACLRALLSEVDSTVRTGAEEALTQIDAAL